MYVWICSYLHKGQPMMKSTLNSWGTSVGIHISFTLMCSAKAREIESSSSTCGLTQLPIFTPIPFSGIPSALCKYYYPNLQNCNLVYVFWVFVLICSSGASLFQLLCGWHPHQRVQELWIHRCPIPEEPAHEDILQSVECRWLGNKRRACEDRLEPSTIHSLLQELQCQCLFVVLWIIFLQFNLSIFYLHQWGMVLTRARFHKPRENEMGAEELHDLQLLRRHKEIPTGPSSWMLCHHHVLEGTEPKAIHFVVCLYNFKIIFFHSLSFLLPSEFQKHHIVDNVIHEYNKDYFLNEWHVYHYLNLNVEPHKVTKRVKSQYYCFYIIFGFEK